MSTQPYTGAATQFGQEDALAGRDMQGSTLYLLDSPEWLAYNAAYNAAAVPAKRVVAIGVSRNRQPFHVVAERGLVK